VGFVWWILEPLASLAVYYVVFGLVLIREIPDYVTFLFVGLVPWRWLNTSLMSGSTSILSAKGVMRQVYLPKLLFPIVAFLTNTFKFGIVFLLVILFVTIQGFPVTGSNLALPLVLLAQAALIVGVSLLVASLTPFLPDLRIVIENLVRLWFFLSGIFYTVDHFPPKARQLFELNPMLHVIEAYRDILMEGHAPDLAGLGSAVAYAVAFGALGIWVLQVNDHRYPKLAF
jgi:lipopolysaccharide transport system permease protein